MQVAVMARVIAYPLHIVRGSYGRMALMVRVADPLAVLI
jgi:hypothetical protein